MKSLIPIGMMAVAVLCAAPASAQQTLRLWEAKAPGSESWTNKESVADQAGGDKRVTDVTDPTLTVYLPDPAKATGAAVIIAPGGAMRMLAIPAYETGPAKWFNDRGIAAFVLKYRLIPSGSPLLSLPLPPMTEFPKGNANPYPQNKDYEAILQMAYADAHQAIRLVRKNAAQWHIDPKRVGMLGYSAGGVVALGAVLTPSPGANPDFVISAYGPGMEDVVPPPNPPPLFLAVRQKHPNVALALIAFFDAWTKAGAPGELHVYDQFDGTPFLANVGPWLDSAYEWMKKRNLAGTAP